MKRNIFCRLCWGRGAPGESDPPKRYHHYLWRADRALYKETF
jgi:hypothetical protein